MFTLGVENQSICASNVIKEASMTTLLNSLYQNDGLLRKGWPFNLKLDQSSEFGFMLQK